MTPKKALTIGLLTITAISLIGCAVILSKNKKANESKADYYYTYVNKDQYNNYQFTIEGNTQIPNLESSIDVYYPYKMFITTGNYKIERTYNYSQNEKSYLKFYYQFVKLYGITQDNSPYYEEVDIILPQNNLTKFLDVEIANTPIQNIQIKNNNCIADQYEVVTQKFDIVLNYTDETTTTLTATTQITNITYTPDENEIAASDYPLIFDSININETLTAFNTELTNSNTTSYNNGQQIGYNEGYNVGYATAPVDSNQLTNPIDVRGLMLNILTMPFTFIKQAFNVTMWEGTPYQFNVGNFILSLIAIASILFIIRLFTSGLSIIGNYTGQIADSKLDREQKRANIENTKAQTANIGKPKEIHTTSDNTSFIYTRKE